MAGVVIGSIALALTLGQLLHSVWRRFFRMPTFRVTYAEFRTRVGKDGERFVSDATIDLVAVGGGQPRAIVNSGLSVTAGESTAGAYPATETAGKRTIEIPSDLPTKIRLTFHGGMPLDGADRIQSDIVLDMASGRTVVVSFTLTRHGDDYRYFAEPFRVLRGWREEGLLDRIRSLLP